MADIQSLFSPTPRQPLESALPEEPDTGGVIVEEPLPTDIFEQEPDPLNPIELKVEAPKDAIEGPVVEPVGADDEFVESVSAGDEFTQGPKGYWPPAVDVLRVQQNIEDRKRRVENTIRASIPDGAEYNSEETWGDGIRGFLAMADISRNDSLFNKQKKFRDYYPDGTLLQVQTADGPALLARKSASDPYQPLPFSGRVAGSVFSEPTVLGTLGSVINPLAAGAGAAGGVAAQTGIESLRGYPEESYLGKAGIEGGIAFTTDIASRGMGRIIMGRARPRFEADALEGAFQIADELGLEPLTTGQTGTLFTRKLFHQVGQTSDRVKETLSKQQISLLKAFREKGVYEGQPDAVLEDVIRAQHKELSGIMQFSNLTRADAGESLQKGIETFRKASQRLRDRYYTKAIELSDDVTFNLDPAQIVARDINIGVLARGVQTRNDAGHFGPVALRRLSEQPEGQLAKAVNDILSLNPKMKKVMIDTPDGKKQWTGFEQVKELRSRLYDLKESSDGEVRRQASRLWQTLSAVMDNPVSGNPAFGAAYKKASNFNHMRENTLGLTYVARALRTDTPYQLSQRYFVPGKTQELEAIRDIVPRPRWEEFRSGFSLDLASTINPRTALNRLRTFQSLDPDGLGMLLDAPAQKDMMQFLQARIQFESSPARTIMGKQMTEAEQIVAFAKEGTVGEIADAVRLSGGINSQYAQAARAGVYKDILDRATTISDQGVEVINPTAMSEAIDAWQKSGKLSSFMTASDIRRLTQVNGYGRIIADTGDIGGAMMGGQIRQSLVDIPIDLAKGQVGKVESVIRKFAANDVTAWLLARQARMGRVKGGDRLPLRELTQAYVLAQSQYRETNHGE